MRYATAAAALLVALLAVLSLLLERCGPKAEAPAPPAAAPAPKAAAPRKAKHPPAVFVTESQPDGRGGWGVVSRKLGCAPKRRAELARAVPPAACAGVPTAYDAKPSCSGSGLVGCMPDASAAVDGCDFKGDWVKLYCVKGRTQSCLDDERCPWREDPDAERRDATLNGRYERLPVCFHHAARGGQDMGRWTLGKTSFIWWAIYPTSGLPDDLSERCSVLVDTSDDLLQARVK